MSRYEKISFATHSKLPVVDIAFHHKKYDGSVPEDLNPTKITKFGAETWSTVELDESDVRELHAKLGEIIEKWDS